MQIYQTIEEQVVTTEVFNITLNRAEAQAFFDITGNIGGMTTGPRGHFDKFRKIMQNHYNFQDKNLATGTIWFRTEE